MARTLGPAKLGWKLSQQAEGSKMASSCFFPWKPFLNWSSGIDIQAL
jgi:hypothetical protein